MVDHTRVPASVVLTHFPRLIEGKRSRFSEELEELSDIVADEFQLSPDKKVHHKNGLIPGWTGQYRSADPSWKTQFDLSKLRVAYAGELTIPTNSVKVSDDLAATHLYLHKANSHDQNPINCMGFYMIPIIEDAGELIFLVDERQGDTYLYPGKWNGVGTSIPVDREDYLDVTIDKINKRYGLGIDPCDVWPIGIVTDNVNNYANIAGWAFIEDPGLPSESPLRKVPVRAFEDFVQNEAPIEEWNYPGLLAICETMIKIGDGAGNPIYAKMGRDIIREQYGRLQKEPLEVKTALENLGLGLVL